MKKFNMQHPFTQHARVFCVLAVMVLVTACSSIRFAYNQGDTLAYWWVNAYLDLDSEQSGALKQDIGKMFDWHRKTQLKDYVQLLSNAQRQLASGQTGPADLKTNYKEVKARTELLANKALPDLAELAMTMKPEQFGRMEKKFSSNNDTFRKKFIKVDTEKKQKLRYKKSMEQFDLWFGGFSNEQEAILRKASDARPLNNEFWLEERVLRQKKIVASLRKIHTEKLNKEATTALLADLLKDIFHREEAPEHRAFYDNNLDGNLNLISTAIRIATPAQKAHAQKRMADWANDFKDLAVSK